MNHTEPKFQILAFAPSLKKAGLLQALAADRHYHLHQPNSTAGALKAASGPLDLILVDDDGSISIPDLVIKAKGKDAEVPILVFRNGQATVSGERIWTLGIEDCLSYSVTPGEFLHHITRALKQRRLAQRYDDLLRENQQLYQLAITDGLTKLINRRHFMERMTSEFARVRRFGGRIGCIICDIDHFKRVNDTFGHQVGDHVLRNVSGLIAKTVRTIDTAGRYGGEEFVLMLPETALDGVLVLADKIRRAIEDFNFQQDLKDQPGPERITISLGCASNPECDVATPDELLHLADQALYHAKQNGRNRAEAAATKPGAVMVKRR